MMTSGRSGHWKSLTMRINNKRSSICTGIFLVLSLLAFSSHGQTRPGTELIEHVDADRPYTSALFVLYTDVEGAPQVEEIKARLFEASMGLEVIVRSETNFEFDKVKQFIYDAIVAGKVYTDKVFVLDFTRQLNPSRELLKRYGDFISKVIAIGEFESDYHALAPQKIKFIAPTALRQDGVTQSIDAHLGRGRRWGFLVTEGEEKAVREKNDQIAKTHKGQFYLNLQAGSWWLLNKRSADNGRFELQGSGNHYRLGLGYGITNRLTLQGGVNFSFERPNQDELQTQLPSNPVPGIDFSSDQSNHLVLSPFLGAKYSFGSRKFRPFLHAGVERVNMEFISLKITVNGLGQARNRFSTETQQLNALRFGGGFETQFSKRIYFNMQLDMLRTSKFDDTFSGVSRFDSMALSLGVTFKLGKARSKQK